MGGEWRVPEKSGVHETQLFKVMWIVWRLNAPTITKTNTETDHSTYPELFRSEHLLCKLGTIGILSNKLRVHEPELPEVMRIMWI